ncbi:cytochrome b-c1 complex subunit 2, mitochondrial-like [Varroa jacobsoni]|uniref:Cytochrome b-c1 complex subunit 2, mitochondrial n=1 Tax=Varroa destructor TaxID=109461 RepID=A0A7M7KQ61_VARDE|nr:cytochrome b-c1 complex subunit 2, mitochondrial-like [Varroa destructor]XP_022670289.1 cytochrome b-c1 complex subunit 2, mitochondrial-like [Varroa destructor]XP_022695066.1 cytochrome b-c1 complex subunit 2, mitochondrial-like [Varroa jacobsoni]
MTSRLALIASLKTSCSRALSAQAAARPQIQNSQNRQHAEELRTTILENGLTIHSRENHSPISRVVIVTKAGARYENGSNLGLTHVLRSVAGLTTKNSSTFAITKNIEWVGGNLYAASTRDHLIYTLECNRDHVALAVGFMNDIVFAPEFRPWELEDAIPRLRVELALYKNNQAARLMDALHKASFRGGLANSLFIRPELLGKIKQSQLKEFSSSHITGPRTVVSAMGVDHERLVHVYKNLTKIPSSSADDGSASRFNASGGEVRVEMPKCRNTMVALAIEASGLANQKEALAFEVVKHILGMSKARVPYSELTCTKLGQAALASKPAHPFSVGAFTAAYSNTGLFGVAVAAHPKEIGSVVKTAVATVRCLSQGVSDAELSAAKLKAKYAIAKRESKATKVARNIAIQQLTQGAPLSYEHAVQVIDSISAQDISSIAQKMSRVKPSIAATGILYDTPHLDELLQ